MDTGFRLKHLSAKILFVGVLVLVGIPLGLFLVVYLSDTPRWVAWWGALALLWCFVIGAYLHARYGGIRSESPSE